MSDRSSPRAGGDLLRGSRRVAGIAVAFLALALGAAHAEAQSGAAPPSVGPVARPAGAPAAAPEGNVRLHVFSLQHQRAADALAVVRPLLSARGVVELDEAANTLAVRDTLPALSRVTLAIRSFDHATRALRFDVQLVHAELSALSPVPRSDALDPDLVAKLKQLLRFQHYALIGRASIASREGELVTYDIGNGYRLAFRVGTLIDERRVRLADLTMLKLAPGSSQRELLRSAINLSLGQPLILGLTRDESSDRALMLVLRCDATRAGD